MERDSLSYLLPGYGLQSYGTARDVAKWPQRDRRSVCRDLISFEEYNPVLAGAAVEAVKRLELLASQSPHADQYRYKGVVISRSMLQRGLSLYRQYITHYLKHHPKVHQEMLILVRQLQPTPQGLPIELYFFSADTAWIRYEALQAEVFDHVLAVTHRFGLSVFQSPSGMDLQQRLRG
jgi:hypothetical protein